MILTLMLLMQNEVYYLPIIKLLIINVISEEAILVKDLNDKNLVKIMTTFVNKGEIFEGVFSYTDVETSC